MYVFVDKSTGEVMDFSTMMETYQTFYDSVNYVWSEFFDMVPVPPDFWN